jgi:hypothetical protein
MLREPTASRSASVILAVAENHRWCPKCTGKRSAFLDFPHAPINRKYRFR